MIHMSKLNLNRVSTSSAFHLKKAHEKAPRKVFFAGFCGRRRRHITKNIKNEFQHTRKCVYLQKKKNLIQLNEIRLRTF